MPIDENYSQQLIGLGHGDREDGSKRVHLPTPVGVLGVSLGIEHMNGTTVEGGARGGAGLAGHNRILFDEGYDFSEGVVGGDDAQILTVEAEDERSFRVAQPDPVLSQRLKKFLEIEFGATNNLKEFTGCGLLRACFGQLCGSRLCRCGHSGSDDIPFRAVRGLCQLSANTVIAVLNVFQGYLSRLSPLISANEQLSCSEMTGFRA
jgi:hypothetical protein